MQANESNIALGTILVSKRRTNSFFPLNKRFEVTEIGITSIYVRQLDHPGYSNIRVDCPYYGDFDVESFSGDASKEYYIKSLRSAIINFVGDTTDDEAIIKISELINKL